VGTGATIWVLLQLVGVAVVPLNAIVLLLWVEPKLLPTIFMDVPTGPLTGFVYEIVGADWARLVPEKKIEDSRANVQRRFLRM